VRAGELGVWWASVRDESVYHDYRASTRMRLLRSPVLLERSELRY
jgi:hypothetical protein